MLFNGVVAWLQVYWMGWQIHVSTTLFAGLVFRDLRFKERRVVYEMSVQEAFAGYSDIYNPSQAQSTYWDSSWGMGQSLYELVEGVDCPFGAEFVDLVYMGTGDATLMPRAYCIFEEATQTAVMRHFDNDFNGGYTFIAAAPMTRLVVRSTATVYNYD
jgi:primary-amine oxidase